MFARLRDANARLRRPAALTRPAVSVSIMPSFGSRWLVPRLGRFLPATRRSTCAFPPPSASWISSRAGRHRHPIRPRQLPGLITIKLADDALIVVAAPCLARKHARWRRSDLNHEMLLRDDHPDAWGRWFRARRAACRTGCDRASSATRRCWWTRRCAVRGWRSRAGRSRWPSWSRPPGAALPKLPALPTGLAYYLVSPRASLRRKPVADFRDWVLSEAESLQLPGQ